MGKTACKCTRIALPSQRDHVIILLEICGVVVVCHVSPTCSFVTVVAGVYEALALCSTSVKTDENYVLGMEMELTPGRTRLSM